MNHVINDKSVELTWTAHDGKVDGIKNPMTIQFVTNLIEELDYEITSKLIHSRIHSEVPNNMKSDKPDSPCQDQFHFQNSQFNQS